MAFLDTATYTKCLHRLGAIKLGALLMDSSPEARSVRDVETFAGEMEMGDIPLAEATSMVVGNKPLGPDLRDLDEVRLLQNFEVIGRIIEPMNCLPNESRSPS